MDWLVRWRGTAYAGVVAGLAPDRAPGAITSALVFGGFAKTPGEALVSGGAMTDALRLCQRVGHAEARKRLVGCAKWGGRVPWADAGQARRAVRIAGSGQNRQCVKGAGICPSGGLMAGCQLP